MAGLLGLPGGIATDLFVHLLTSIHFVMDAKMPARVTAMGQNYLHKDTHEVPDTINAVLEYPEGFVSEPQLQFNNESSAESGFEVLGNDGVAGVPRQPDGPQAGEQRGGQPLGRQLPARGAREGVLRRPSHQGGGTPGHVVAEDAQAERDVRRDRGRTTPSCTWPASSIRCAQHKPAVEDAVMGHHAAAAAHMVNLSLRQRRPLDWNFATDTLAQGLGAGGSAGSCRWPSWAGRPRTRPTAAPCRGRSSP